MTSLILRTTARFLMPLLLMFSVFLFLRGHNQPGGGFAGGLMAAAPFALYSIAFGAAEARHVLQIKPRFLTGAGLLTSLASGVIGLLNGRPFLAGVWWNIPLTDGSSFKIGTPILFDLGVYLTVVGVTLTIIFALEEAE